MSGLLKRKMQLAAATETTPGTAVALGASNVIGLCYDMQVVPNIEMHQRPKQGSAGHHKAQTGLQEGTVTFKTDLYGDGAGTTPVAFEVLLPACGLVQSADTFTCTLEAPGSNTKTLTIAVFEDGRRKLLAGCVGNAVLKGETGKGAYIEWTFKGKWSGVTDVALLSPTLPTVLPLKYANTTLSVLGNTSMCTANMSIDFGNELVLRECQSDSSATGYVSGIVPDRLSILTIDPEAQLVATDDPYQDWLDMDEGALSIVFDDGTDILTISGTIQPTNIQPGDRNKVITDNMTYQFNNDSLQLVWSAS